MAAISPRALAVVTSVLGLLAGLTVPTPGAAAAAPRAAPTYARAHTAYLVGTMLYLPTGEAVHLPVRPALAPTTDLLGAGDGGWVVGAGRGYHVWTGSTLVTVGGRTLGGVRRYELLSSDGTHVVSASFDATDALQASVVALDGTSVALPTATNVKGSLSAAVGGTAYVVGASGVDELVAGADEADRLSTVATDLVDPEHGVAFVRPGNRKKSGPAPFDPELDPAVGAATWTARFHAVRVSADGTRVLGTGPVDGRRRLQVRQLSDGALLASFPMPDQDQASDVVGWDGPDGTAVLAVVAVGAQRALTRCAVRSGTCRRVTPPTSAPITLGTADAGVRTYP